MSALRFPRKEIFVQKAKFSVERHFVWKLWNISNFLSLNSQQSKSKNIFSSNFSNKNKKHQAKVRLQLPIRTCSASSNKGNFLYISVGSCVSCVGFCVGFCGDFLYVFVYKIWSYKRHYLPSVSHKIILFLVKSYRLS